MTDKETQRQSDKKRTVKGFEQAIKRVRVVAQLADDYRTVMLLDVIMKQASDEDGDS